MLLEKIYYRKLIFLLVDKKYRINHKRIRNEKNRRNYYRKEKKKKFLFWLSDFK